MTNALHIRSHKLRAKNHYFEIFDHAKNSYTYRMFTVGTIPNEEK